MRLLGRLQHRMCSIAHAATAHEKGSNASMSLGALEGVKYSLFLIGGLQDILKALDHPQRVCEGHIHRMDDGVEGQL